MVVLLALVWVGLNAGEIDVKAAVDKMVDNEVQRIKNNTDGRDVELNQARKTIRRLVEELKVTRAIIKQLVAKQAIKYVEHNGKMITRQEKKAINKKRDAAAMKALILHAKKIEDRIAELEAQKKKQFKVVSKMVLRYHEASKNKNKSTRDRMMKSAKEEWDREAKVLGKIEGEISRIRRAEHDRQVNGQRIK